MLPNVPLIPWYSQLHSPLMALPVTSPSNVVVAGLPSYSLSILNRSFPSLNRRSLAVSFWSPGYDWVTPEDLQ